MGQGAPGRRSSENDGDANSIMLMTITNKTEENEGAKRGLVVPVALHWLKPLKLVQLIELMLQSMQMQYKNK